LPRSLRQGWARRGSQTSDDPFRIKSIATDSIAAHPSHIDMSQRMV